MKWLVLGAVILAAALFVKDKAHAAPAWAAPVAGSSL